ncbi:hypothetical protein OAE65_01675, partial [bacterium]|nr:hypothetical protein [bacterium]
MHPDIGPSIAIDIKPRGLIEARAKVTVAFRESENSTGRNTFERDMICEFEDLGTILIRYFKSPFSDIRVLGDYKFNPSPSITFDPGEERIERRAG